MGCAGQVLRHLPSTKVWIRRDPWPLGNSNKQCFFIWHCCCDLLDLSYTVLLASMSYLSVPQMMLFTIRFFQHICTSVEAQWVWSCCELDWQHCRQRLIVVEQLQPSHGEILSSRYRRWRSHADTVAGATIGVELTLCKQELWDEFISFNEAVATPWSVQVWGVGKFATGLWFEMICFFLLVQHGGCRGQQTTHTVHVYHLYQAAWQ